MLKQTKVTSFDDVTDVSRMYIGVGIKVSMHETQGFSSVIHSFGPFNWFSWLVWEATDPLTQLTQCLSRSGIISS